MDPRFICGNSSPTKGDHMVWSWPQRLRTAIYNHYQKEVKAYLRKPAIVLPATKYPGREKAN